MNILILGPGAIGSLWAHKFKHAGHHVSVWSTSRDPEITLQFEHQAPHVFLNQDVAATQQADLILVTVKAWQVKQAITPLLPHISQDAVIALMHNGMGTADTIANLLPNNPIVLSTTTHGAYKPNKQQVLHTGLGQTQLGGYNEQGKKCDFLAPVFEHAQPSAQWNENIEHALWIKLAINCAINPLTAIHQVNNGKLTEGTHQKTIASLLDEVCAILRAEAVPIEYAELLTTVNRVIESTAENHSSMQQDIFHQRPSEIDFITGYLLKRAEHHGISAANNHELYQAIKQIEQSWNS
ncbi:2-dehydropantoate 2-reductase [Vibrio sp. M260118]|uniref:2-dehydropantoate 2-reductase n=1 Tax=Vibrio sp. M260118 TaxID=3020896 RepID=UPI002F3EFDED